MFDHKRSSSRATFDQVHQCWVSECKRCFKVLVRQEPGEWREAPADVPPRLLSEDLSVRSAKFTIFAGTAGPRFNPGSLPSARFTIISDPAPSAFETLQ